MRVRRTPIRISEHQALLPFRAKRMGILSYAALFEQRILLSLGVALCLISLAYAYFLISSIWYVSERGNMTAAIHNLSGKTATLEAAYLARSVDITESYAAAKGLVRVSGENFIERTQGLSYER